jgi:hypothetical protein
MSVRQRDAADRGGEGGSAPRTLRIIAGPSLTGRLGFECPGEPPSAGRDHTDGDLRSPLAPPRTRFFLQSRGRRRRPAFGGPLGPLMGGSDGRQLGVPGRLVDDAGVMRSRNVSGHASNVSVGLRKTVSALGAELGNTSCGRPLLACSLSPPRPWDPGNRGRLLPTPHPALERRPRAGPGGASPRWCRRPRPTALACRLVEKCADLRGGGPRRRYSTGLGLRFVAATRRSASKSK